MDRARLVGSFGAAALAILLAHVVSHFGYSSVQALTLLAAIGVVSVLTIGMTGAVAGALAFAAYDVIDNLLNDPLTAAGILGTIAAFATLVQEGKGAWRK